MKAALYPWAEGKYDEQDSFVFVPMPSFFGIKYRKKKYQSSLTCRDSGPQLVFKYASAAPLLLARKNGCKWGRIQPSNEKKKSLPVMYHIKPLAIPKKPCSIPLVNGKKWAFWSTTPMSYFRSLVQTEVTWYLLLSHKYNGSSEKKRCALWRFKDGWGECKVFFVNRCVLTDFSSSCSRGWILK